MGNQTYFISDLHLGAAYISDHRAHERLITRFLDTIACDAQRLYMLGDVLDYWWDYRTVVPRGNIRFFGALARLADAGIELTWLKGNHDIWLFDYFRDELGVNIVDGLLTTDIDGHRFVMEHGDGVGPRSTGFRLIRSLFRNPVAQKIYASIHPRWTIPFAHRWSHHSRANGGYSRQSDNVCAPLAEFSRQYLTDTDPTVDYFVYGHVHEAVDTEIAPGKHMIVLGDWIDKFTYACFDGSVMSLNRFTP